MMVSTISEPEMEEDRVFSMRQEAVRKCVERLFGVLKSRFDILDRPGRLWYKEDMNTVLRACVIMHNMIVQVSKDEYVFDGAGNLRGMTEANLVTTLWEDRQAATTARPSIISSMRSMNDQDRLKRSLARHISNMVSLK